jgi:HK97 family phage portal protein
MRFFPFKKKSMRFSQLLPEWRTNQDAKFNDWSTERAIREGLKSSTYVYSCIQLIARSIASVPWGTYKQKTNKEWVEIEGHPLTALIERPTPYHNRKDLMEGMAHHLYLGGNAIFTKVRAGGTVAELWQLPTDAIKVIPSRKDFIDHYFYELDGVRQRFEQKDIIHNKFNDPANPYWGLAPLQAGARTVDTDVEAVRFQKVSLQNRAISDGIFTFENHLTKDQWEEARAMVREQHQGIDNARTPWILGAGAKWQQMSLSPAELDFLNSRKFSREEICSIFNVPPPMIGILENSTYNNIETARKIFWQDCIIPLLEDIKNCFNLSLTPEFGQGIELSFDISNVEALQTSNTEKMATAQTLFGMGVPFNQINQRLELGFDPIEGGDTGYLAANLMPANILEQGPQEPEPNPTDPPKDEKPPEDDKKPPKDDEKDPPKGKGRASTKNIKASGYMKSDEEKELVFKSLDRKRDLWVINMTRKSAKLFEAEGEEIIKALANGGKWETALSKHQENWKTFLKTTYTAMIEDIGNEHFNNLAKSHRPQEYKGLLDFFNPYKETIKNYIIKLAGTKVTMVSDWTRQIIGAIVLDAQENNLTMDELAKNIRTEFKEFSRYRAYRIARTEAQNALGFAQYEAGKQAEEILGQKLIGEWWTSLDDRVRDSHAAIHGERAELGKAFSNGLLYAGEYTQTEKTGDNINCRCVILHHFE